MKSIILENANNPEALEKLYRGNKSGFKKDFNLLFPENKGVTSFQYWNERLNYESDKITFGGKNELGVVILLALLSGLIANIPNITGINDEQFFSRNIPFIVIPLLSSYFIWKQKRMAQGLLFPAIVFIISVCYINFLPIDEKSNSILLACIHLPLFLWTVLGISYLGDDIKNTSKRIEFLRFNGDLVVMCAIIVLSGALFSGITIGLFELIDIKIENIYFQYIAIWGIAAVPMVASYLIQNNPQLISKVSPIIAKIFTPLVFINLSIYLIAVFATGKYPNNDRNLLLIFNALLIGVLALILFSVAEAGKGPKNKFNTFLLFGLSIITILINCIALYAISFRIMEWGITPNRMAILGGNLLIFINLLLVSYKLLSVSKGKAELETVENTIALFLPIYGIWTGLVTFVFPLLFQFK